MSSIFFSFFSNQSLDRAISKYSDLLRKFIYRTLVSNHNLRGGEEEGVSKDGGALAGESEVSILVSSQMKCSKAGD